MSKKVDKRIKVITVGDSFTGKSTIIGRYVDENFESTYITTICLDFRLKYVERRGKKIRVDIYDTAGQERFRSISRAYYKHADICILICDVTVRKTFENIEYWMTQLKENVVNDDAIIMIVGNKVDLEEERVVDTRELASLAHKYQCKFVETSAKNNTNIEYLFDTLIDDVMRDNVVSSAETNDVSQKFEIEDKKVKDKSNSCC